MRGFYVAEELRKHGITCNIIYGRGIIQYIRFLFNIAVHDIVYFQKRYSGADIGLNRLARLMGKITFFDIDDAPGETKLKPEVEKRAVKMIGISSAVVVGSSKLLSLKKSDRNSIPFSNSD